MRKISISLLIIVLTSLCLILGCGTDKTKAEDSISPPKTTSPGALPRDSTPQVLIPEASGIAVSGNEKVTYDASHLDQGYIMVKYQGDNPKVLLQMFAPNGSEYLYVVQNTGNFDTVPLPAGNGLYKLRLMENTEDDKYLMAYTQDFQVSLSNELLPFLYPNLYVNFATTSPAVTKGSELAKDAYSDLEAIQNIYKYVVNNTVYDREKAENVAFGYRPNPDETLATKEGICFDYASLMTSMLRSQRIPTKLEVGYAGEVYHAWISTYTTEQGWIDDIIYFDGESWVLMDPTFAASSDKEVLKEFIGEGGNYVIDFTY